MSRFSNALRLSLLALSLAAASRGARAYPSFIAYGYGSCLSCHFNPLGDGPLTDYGRAVSATAISARPFFAQHASDDQLAEQSGLLGSVKLPHFIRPSASYRGLLLASRIQDGPTWTRYNMKADAQLVLRTDEDRIVASGTIGYIPAAPGKSNLISREHYVGARWGENWGTYAGLMDIAYGLRVPDHEAFSRSLTGLKQNDQSYGLLTHYTSEKTEGALHAFVGNFTQDSTLRPKGASATVEREFWAKNRLGVSVLHASNDYRSRWQGSVHHRVQFREGSGLISEIGVVRATTLVPSTNLSPYLFVQGLQRLFRGFHLIATAEAMSAEAFAPADRYYRLNPGVQWFPMQRLELRLDLGLQWKRAVAGVGNDFSFDGFGQAALTF